MTVITPDRACPTCGQFGQPLALPDNGPPVYECRTCLELWEIVK